MKIRITIVLFFIALLSYGQQNFELGYFIDNAGTKTNCLIKNMDWRSNPTAIKWKASTTTATKIATIENIKEFHIGALHHYIRHTLSFDLSPTKVSELSIGRHINSKERTVFLKLLVTSEIASLYGYQHHDIQKFFYTKADQELPQLLVYKAYLIPGHLDNISYNNDYQYQLKTVFPTAQVKSSTTPYKKKELIRYFEKYLLEQNDHAFVSTDKKTKTTFGVFAGLDVTSFEHFLYNTTYTFDTTTGLRVGAFIENTLPFYNNKLSLFFDAGYTAFHIKSPADNNSIGAIQIENRNDITYKSLDFTGGIKFYFFLNPTSSKELIKLYLEAGVSLIVQQKTKWEPLISSDSEMIPIATNFPVGVGIHYKKYILGYRCYSSRNILSSYQNRDSALLIHSIHLGFTLF